MNIFLMVFVIVPMVLLWGRLVPAVRCLVSCLRVPLLWSLWGSSSANGGATSDNGERPMYNRARMLIRIDMHVIGFLYRLNRLHNKGRV